MLSFTSYLAKFFFLRYQKTDGDDYEPDNLSGLHRSIQKLLSEAGLFSLSFHDLKGNW